MPEFYYDNKQDWIVDHLWYKEKHGKKLPNKLGQ
jgi:hypothetical protein